MSTDDLSDFSLHDLFRMEVEGQRQVFTDGLLVLERSPMAAGELEACMRAAHSLKGAARIVGLVAAVNVAHTMEDCLVEAQQGRITLGNAAIDALLGGVDLLCRRWMTRQKSRSSELPWNWRCQRTTLPATAIWRRDPRRQSTLPSPPGQEARNTRMTLATALCT